jgi:hypothetical protein
MSQPIITTDTTRNNGPSSFPVTVSPDLAQAIDALAAKRQITVDTLINDVLRHYLLSQTDKAAHNGKNSLLSMAGMFDSGSEDTSENVRDIVKNFILDRHS